MGLDNDDIKQLIAILQRGLVDDEGDSEEPTPKKRPTKAKNQATKKKKNNFDTMSEKNMHKDDIEIDRKLRQAPPTSRSRNYKPLSVKCRICGKTEKVNPALVEAAERYKCNKCCTSSG